MSEQTPLVTPRASGGVRGYPLRTETYLFVRDTEEHGVYAGSLLIRKLPYWRPAQEKYIHEDGSVEYPGGEAGAIGADRVKLLEAAIIAIEQVDRNLADDFRNYFQI